MKKPSPKTPAETTQMPFPLIAITDDESLVLDFLEIVILGCCKHAQIVKFRSARSAMSWLAFTNPDLLITDINNDLEAPPNVKQLNGLDLLSMLARVGVSYPILIVSGGFLNKHEEKKARRAAGSGLSSTFWTKPCNSEMLIKYLQENKLAD